MRKKAILAIMFLFCAGLLLPKASPWGQLKKIHYFDSVGQYDRMMEQLSALNLGDVKREEQRQLAQRLISFGDNYFEAGKYEYAEAFYRKLLAHSPGYWYLYTKLDKIEKEKGSMFFSFKHVFNQMFMVLKNFDTSFLVQHYLFNYLFFAGLFAFFVFGLIMFIKYFRLTGNDLIIGEDGRLSLAKTAIVIVAMLWPVLFLAGWMIYPFLFAGFLWFYMNDNEKKSVFLMMIVIAVVMVLYSVNVVLEDSYTSDKFRRVRQVYSGHLFEKTDYDRFDDELKVAQAYSYYENGQYDTALDILNSTGTNYNSILKYNLTGCIYYRFGEIGQAGDYFRQSLSLKENPTAMNNFAMVLLKEKQPNVFTSYTKRYPEIEKYRTSELKLREPKLPAGVLWKRLFSFSGEGFSPVGFFKSIVGKLFSLPLLYYILLFVLYINMVKKVTPSLGESTYCSKCTKIIKEASVHRSYKLCDECYQLFSIKDVIFLEAKILKEKELRKKFNYKYMFYLIFSILVPGLNFHQRENNRLFLLFSMTFYFLAFFAIFGAVNFNRLFAASPLFLNLILILAVGVYFIVNLISVLGDEDGI